MEVPKLYFRGTLSLALVLIVATVFSLSSFAAPRAGDVMVKPVAQEPSAASAATGLLTGRGRVTINGNAARSGATILSGTTIATGADGNALIDLGQLGRVELTPNTTVMLVFSPGVVTVSVDDAGMMIQSLPPGVEGRVRTHGECARFTVTRGHLDVKSIGDDKMLNAGDATTIDKAVEAVSGGDSDFSVEFCDNTGAVALPPAGTTTPGVVGIVSMFGVATAVAVGVIAGKNDRGNSTPPKASEVVP